MSDHLGMMIAIQPKYVVAQVIGYNKGQECDSLGQRIRGGAGETLWSTLPRLTVLRIDAREASKTA